MTDRCYVHSIEPASACPACNPPRVQPVNDEWSAPRVIAVSLAASVVFIAALVAALWDPPAPQPFNLSAAIEACHAHCSPHRAAWRYEGQALACACDDLTLEAGPNPKRRIIKP